MDMIGQYYYGVDCKWVARLREPCRLAQRVDMVRQQAASPVRQINQNLPGTRARR